MGRGACLVGEPVTSQSGPSQPLSHLPRFWPPPPPPRTPDFRVGGFWGAFPQDPSPGMRRGAEEPQAPLAQLDDAGDRVEGFGVPLESVRGKERVLAGAPHLGL